MQQIISEFENPPREYRARPFWAWNGKLDRQEVLRQIDCFAEMGFGGFFMHARTGLQTGYLSPEWFELTDACTRAGRAAGLLPWIYDEDRWPSGSAGGIVTREVAHRRKYLTMTCNETAQTEPPLAEFAARCRGLRLSAAYRRIEPGTALLRGETRLTFRVHTMQPQSVYNGAADADRLSAETTQRFLSVTHRQYRAQCAAFPEIEGVFTDEPHRGMIFSEFSDPGEERRRSLPWTDDLPEQFSARFGEELIPRLPELFLQRAGERVATIKWQYMELLQELFEARYLEPIRTWAHENGKKTTGHFLHEDSLTAQVVPTGSVMRCYAYLDEPGIDNLTEHSFAPWAVKQLESVARQLGKTKKLSELYAATGWQMSFRDYKYVADWQILLGINVRCPHLAWYTMEGEAKRDYPGSFLDQSAWWREHEHAERYFARLGYVASQGIPVCDTLVLHPAESLWYQIYPGWVDGLAAKDRRIQMLEKQFQAVFHAMMASGTDFDYGDEGLLEKYGAVDTEKTPVLRIGNMAYRRVLVAGCPCIRESTDRLLRRFRACGGEVIYAGAPPRYIGGKRTVCRDTDAVQPIRLPLRERAITAYFLKTEKPVSIVHPRARTDLYMQTRKTDDGLFVLLWNKSRKRSYRRVRVRIPSGMHAELWDCTTGARSAIGCEPSLDFAPGQERVLYLTRCEHHSDAQTAQPRGKRIHPKLTGYRLHEPNVLPLDRAQLFLNGKRLSKTAEFLCLDDLLRRTLGLELRGGEAVQPWAKPAAQDPGVPITLRYTVHVARIPDAPICLAMEPLPMQTIRLNGKNIPLRETQIRWVDNCFRVYELPADAWKTGKNTLELSARYADGNGLEAMFLLGQFGVRLRGATPVLDRLPRRLHCRDLVGQGLPFYSGKITYHFAPLPRGTYRVSMPKIGGSCAAFVCGEDRTVLLWPWQTAQAELRQDTPIALEVMLTRRNTFGPLHRFPRKQQYVAPDSFRNARSRRYCLYPSGLTQRFTPQRME